MQSTPPVTWPRQPDSFLGALTVKERTQLLEMAVMRTYQPGYILMMEDDPSSDVMVLVSGWAKATYATAGGEEVVLRLYSPGAVFGTEAALAGQPRSETIIALEQCTALLIPAPRFTALLAHSPGIARAFNLAMLLRARDADEQMRLRNTPADVRLARVLIDLADRAGRRTPDGITIPVDLSQEDLASLISSSRSTVARTFRSLRRQGLIRTGYRHITITTLAELRTIARASG
jgi:CRP/FNR family transcriptional regulator, cyclic AMP receptor protein